VDIQLHYLPDTLQSGEGQAQRPLRHNTQIKFFSGAAETLARVRILGQKSLPAGESGWAQLRLQEPVALVQGDRFIIRRPSPPATLGGGVVVDPNPGRKHRRFQPQVLERLETLAQGSPAEILLQTLERQGPTVTHDLFLASGLGEAAPEALAQLLDEDQAVLLGPQVDVKRPIPKNHLLAARSWWAAMTERLSGEVSAYHRRFPLRVGMGREALRSGLKLEAKVFNAMMARAAVEGIIADEGATVRLPSHEVRLNSEQQMQVDALLARFRSQPYTTPSVKESTAAVGEEVLSVLVNRGDLVQVSPDVLFLPTAYEEMTAHIREHIEREGSITLAGTRDMLETSRKYAQALLEHLDEAGMTKRVGDERILR
jgi:selenocysteine-specific elongation factor